MRNVVRCQPEQRQGRAARCTVWGTCCQQGCVLLLGITAVEAFLFLPGSAYNVSCFVARLFMSVSVSDAVCVPSARESPCHFHICICHAWSYSAYLLFHCCNLLGSWSFIRNGVVSIATVCALNGPGINTLCGRDFSHSSIPALKHTQPPTQWVPAFSPGGKAAWAWRSPTIPSSYTSTPSLWAFVACFRANFTFT